jgi:hypothetical protein
VVEQPDDLFIPAVDSVLRNVDIIPSDIVFYGETLGRKKHNVLDYGCVPLNNIALFAAMKIHSQSIMPYNDLRYWARRFRMATVPILWEGEIDPRSDLLAFMGSLLNFDSVLGNTKIEGVVVKNYNLDGMIGGQYLPYLTGKFVSERFREKSSRKAYGAAKTRQSLIEYFKSFRTEARWQKAIQHLRDDGTLTGEPKDIGPLLKELWEDFRKEEEANIMAWLWRKHEKQIHRSLIAGFPEWYKEQILKGEIDVDGKIDEHSTTT